MNIIELNNKIETFVQQNDLTADALALKQENAISSSAEWQKVLEEFADEGRVLRVGIIGRVKAGKSSMLNALLFNGKDILPKAATPMTAALTIMEYSDSVSAEVDFFTQKDIDDIKLKHDVYLNELAATKQQKLAEQKERAEKRKQQNSPTLLNAFTGISLSPEELRECEEKAASQAEREMKNHATYASYDQYQRIKASGKTLQDLQQYQTIQAASIEDLVNGELNQFVGSSGQFMPFTKSVTLRIPDEGLKGLQIIDTPGINDPVTSRGERTEELLQHCDVVLVVSPSGQFLSSEDTDLLHRVTTKEGTQQAYLIASQVDNQLFGSERAGLHRPEDVLVKISSSLTAHARSVLSKQVSQFPEMKTAADKLAQHNVLCSSSVAYSMLQRFDDRASWDNNLNHVWNNLNRHYADTFNNPETAKAALTRLANIDQLHAIVDDVTANKANILAQRRIDFEKQKQTALQNYLKGWENRLNEQVFQIENADVGELRQQEQTLKNQQTKIALHVDGVYEDLVDDIRLNLDKELKDKLTTAIRQYESSTEGAQGTATESRQVYEGRGGFLWLKKIYRTETYEVATVQASSIRRAIENVRSSLEDELGHAAGNYVQKWRKAIYNSVVGALREALGDAELDITLIARSIKAVLARIPEYEFKLEGQLPQNLRKSGQLRGGEAESYINEAENYVSELKHTIREEISSYIHNMVSSLKNVKLSKDLTAHLEQSLSKLLSEIENKEASLFRYQKIRGELEALQNEANG